MGSSNRGARSLSMTATLPKNQPLPHPKTTFWVTHWQSFGGIVMGLSRYTSYSSELIYYCRFAELNSVEPISDNEHQLVLDGLTLTMGIYFV